MKKVTLFLFLLLIPLAFSQTNFEWLSASNHPFEIRSIFNISGSETIQDAVSNGDSWFICGEDDFSIGQTLRVGFKDAVGFGGTQAIALSNNFVCTKINNEFQVLECQPGGGYTQKQTTNNKTRVRTLGAPTTLINDSQINLTFPLLSPIIQVINLKNMQTNIKNWSEYDTFEFFFKTNEVEPIQITLLNGDAEDISKLTPIIRLNLYDFVTNTPEKNKWLHVSINITGFNDAMAVDKIAFSANISKLSEDLKIKIKRIYLKNDQIKFCTQPDLETETGPLVQFFGWIPDLDTIKLKSQTPFFPSKHACNANPSFNWTGTKCCGDDLGESYNDTKGACWLGEYVAENETIGTINLNITKKVTPQKTVIYQITINGQNSTNTIPSKKELQKQTTLQENMLSTNVNMQLPTLLDYYIQNYTLTGNARFSNRTNVFTPCLQKYILFNEICQPEIKDLNPLFYWPINDKTGETRSRYESIQLDDLTNKGLSRTEGKIGLAYEFNGSTQAEAVKNDILDDDTQFNGFSATLWFKTTNNGGLFSVGKNLLGKDGHDRHIYLSNGKVCSRVWLGASNSVICTTENYNDNEWHHVALTLGNKGHKIYIDGEEKASSEATQSAFKDEDRIQIGFSNDANPQFFTGLIDEVILFKRQINQTEIQKIYELKEETPKKEATITITNNEPSITKTITKQYTCKKENCTYPINGETIKPTQTITLKPENKQVNTKTTIGDNTKIEAKVNKQIIYNNKTYFGCGFEQEIVTQKKSCETVDNAFCNINTWSKERSGPLIGDGSGTLIKQFSAGKRNTIKNIYPSTIISNEKTYTYTSIPKGNIIKTEKLEEDKDYQLSGYVKTDCTNGLYLDLSDRPTPQTDCNTQKTNSNKYAFISCTKNLPKGTYNIRLVSDNQPTGKTCTATVTNVNIQPKTNLKYKKLLVQGTKSSCCPSNACWNGTGCVANQIENPNPNQKTYDENRCINGEWKKTRLLKTWDGTQKGYCPKPTQCLVNPTGNQTNNNNETAFYLADTEANEPQCINNTQYLLDNYCEQGNWTSRTKLLAKALVDLIKDDSTKNNYTLFCGSTDETLPVDNYVTGGIEPINYLLGLPQTDKSQSLPLLTCIGKYSCVNNFCTAIYEASDGTEKRVIATSSNIDITDQPHIIKAFGEDPTQCQGTKSLTGFNFQKCGPGTLYSPELKITIHSNQDLTIGQTNNFFKPLIKAVRNIINLFKQGNELPQDVKNRITHIEKGRRVYIRESGDKKITAFFEQNSQDNPENQSIIIEYENIDPNICTTLLNIKPPIGDVSSINCVNTATGARVFIEKPDELTLWQDLTSKLRIK